MAFNFPAFSYIIALIIDAFLIFFAIFHVSILYSFVFIVLKSFLGYVNQIVLKNNTHYLIYCKAATYIICSLSVSQVVRLTLGRPKSGP